MPIVFSLQRSGIFTGFNFVFFDFDFSQKSYIIEHGATAKCMFLMQIVFSLQRNSIIWTPVFTFCFLEISHTLNISLHGSTATCNFYVFWWFRYSFGHCFCYPQRQDVTSDTLFSLGIEFSRRSKRCSYPREELSSVTAGACHGLQKKIYRTLKRARVIDYKRKSIERYIGSVSLITKENLSNVTSGACH